MQKKKQAGKRKVHAKPNRTFVFISYRRVDSAAAARWLYSAIKQAFGPGCVFMDTEEIRKFDEWPHAISHALRQATHLIAVIGPHWLSVADAYGRRRLDGDEDWVRREIVHALENRKRICRSCWRRM